ncbi:SDR family oxidoreductase [Verrucomicrobia bacterium]|nr:SDR family oxidoreductase [Verrucomicrobiota bacterium]
MSVKIDLGGKVGIVTGGTRGIGLSISQKLLEAGADVIVTGTGTTQLNSSLLNHKRIHFIKADFLNLDDVKSFIQSVFNQFKQIDFLINNAGINIVEESEHLKFKSYENVRKVNLDAPIILTTEIGKSMISNNYGRIVNISSIWSVSSRPERLSYSISKNGLVGLTKTLALEWASKNILVNAVSPGFTMTELTKKTNTENEMSEIKSSIPLRRLADTEEIANLVLFLISDLNTYITGQNILIDGGYTIT